MLAADTLGEYFLGGVDARLLPALTRPRLPPTRHRVGSYGSLAKFTDLRRIRRVGASTLIAGSGEYSDFQCVELPAVFALPLDGAILVLECMPFHNPPALPPPHASLRYIMDTLDALVTEERILEDGAALGADEIRAFLSRVMYNRRNKMNPLWNSLLIAGYSGTASTLGYVDQRGLTFVEDYAATGYAAHLAMPLIRERWAADMDEAAARTLLEDCLRVLWYRDCKALNKVQIAKITSAGVVAISEPYAVETKWDYAAFVQPKAGAETGGSW